MSDEENGKIMFHFHHPNPIRHIQHKDYCETWMWGRWQSHHENVSVRGLARINPSQLHTDGPESLTRHLKLSTVWQRRWIMTWTVNLWSTYTGCHCAECFTCIISSPSISLWYISLFCMCYHRGDWSLMKLNNLLKVTCSTASRKVLRLKTRSNLNCILEIYPVVSMFAHSRS